jgi:hypothetical protein
MKTRINMMDAVNDLAPPPPPCFLTAHSWRVYLTSAAGAQNSRKEPRVILIAEDGTPAFNRKFNFCADCTQIKSVEMMGKGRCDPKFLKRGAA